MIVKSRYMSGDIEDQSRDLERIEESLEAARSSVNENTQLLQAKEQASKASYSIYYLIIAIESTFLLLLLYIGL
jgi:hypothetical protein